MLGERVPAGKVFIWLVPWSVSCHLTLMTTSLSGTGDDFFIFTELSPGSLVPAASNPHPGRAVEGGNQMGEGGTGVASKGFPLVGYFILPNCW